MGVSQKSIILASRLNQRAIEFFNSAESLRVNFSAAVHVIDYCTALSFELQLKSILAARDIFKDGEVDEKHRRHNICNLFDECKITFDSDKHNELITYYNAILNGIGRYSTTAKGYREKLDNALSGMLKKADNYFHTPNDNCVYEINLESGIVENSYKEIWGRLSEIFNAEYAAAQENQTP